MVIGTLVALMIPGTIVFADYNIYSNHNHPGIGESYDGKVPKDQQEVLDRAKKEKEKIQASGVQTPTDLLVKFPDEQIKKIEEKTDYDVKYNEYLPSRYTLELVYNEANWWDLDEMASNTGHFFSHGTTNAIWMQLVRMGFSVIDFTVDVFTLDVPKKFADEIGSGIREYAGFTRDGSMRSDGLWGHLLTGIIFMVGCWAVFVGLAMRRVVRFWTGLLGSMLIMILFIGFYLNAGPILKVMNDGSEQLSTKVLQASQAFITDKEVPQEAYPYILADHIYHMNIFVPYVIEQHNGVPEDTVHLKPAEVDLPARQKELFREEIEHARQKQKEAEQKAKEGKVTRERIEAILDHELGSENRKNAVLKEKDEYDNRLVTTLGTQERLKSMGLLAFLLILESIVFFVINLAAATFQILFILLTLLSPVVGIVAIFPPLSRIAKKWFELWFMSLVAKLMITVFLSLLFFISNLMYKIVPPETAGYDKTLLWQIVILLAVIIFRKPLFGIFVKPSAQVHIQTIQNTIQRGKQMAQRGVRRGVRGAAARGAARGARGRTA